MKRLINGLGLQIVGVTSASARRIANAYETWGKGVHTAGLNFGDCFAYEVAKKHGCLLLSVGDDFARTDIDKALGREARCGRRCCIAYGAGRRISTTRFSTGAVAPAC